MKTQPVHFGAALALLLTTAAAQADHVDPYRLEPSINGGVSATGRFASQAGEDRYLAGLVAQELEPCINGGVSATGRFASQGEEDARMDRLAGG